MHKFIGRKNELAALATELGLARPSLIIVLGRRRVGKSRLLLEAGRGRPFIYYQATKIASSMSLSFFKAECSKTLGPDPVFESLGDWQGTLAYLARVAKRLPGLTATVDEFPYLCEVDPSLPSVVQKFWDSLRNDPFPFNLVLCGSKISFMQDMLAERNPLHGRQTLRLDVAPLTCREAATFFPRFSSEDRLRAWSIFGGIPYYLSLCAGLPSLKASVIELVLTKGAPLVDEPDALLQAELRDVSRYATVLRAIADGCTKSGDIVGRAREFPSAQSLAPYLEKLEHLRLIRVARSLDAADKERGRRYYLDDPFLAFWFRFCLPNISAISSGHGSQVWQHVVAPQIDEYMGNLFEWICRDHARLHIQELLPSAAQTIGQVWSGDFDIDVAGLLLDGSALYGECKWWSSAVGENVFDGLIERARATAYGREAKDRFYLLYSRSGFTKDLQHRAAKDGAVRLVSPEMLLKEARLRKSRRGVRD